EMGVSYVSIDTLYKSSDIISLHCPLTPENRHMINHTSLQHMKYGVVLLNTSRGALIDTIAVIEAIKNGKIGGIALDVYEKEVHVIFRELSDTIIHDDTLQRLLSFPTVLITAHQDYFTQEALTQIASTTLSNIVELL